MPVFRQILGLGDKAYGESKVYRFGAEVAGEQGRDGVAGVLAFMDALCIVSDGDVDFVTCRQFARGPAVRDAFRDLFHAGKDILHGASVLCGFMRYFPGFRNLCGLKCAVYYARLRVSEKERLMVFRARMKCTKFSIK